MRKILIIVVVILALSSLGLGMGWISTERQLTTLSEQSAFTISGLTQQLGEAQEYGSYWWGMAHPKEFESLETLKAWLMQDNTESAFTDTTDINYDCDDYARGLMRNALEDGYLISTQIDIFKAHMFNSAMIGNDIYFIEPQTDEVWFSGHID
ncbi:MAG: hypothetical protein MUP81_02235 [Dehalococcoidia bacterium]|nr:hypothetical protein [Dehalococcoidia bacterium]